MLRALCAIAVAMMATLRPAVAACDSPAYKQFDFWVGNWRVTSAQGKLLGHDLVTKRLKNCVVYEEYRDANDPSVGYGFTAYDAGRHQWHQTFVDDSGFVLELDGGVHDGAMVLEGTDYLRGRARLNRGVWRRRGDAVEELWTVSDDGGRTWTTRFDGWFRRTG